MNLEPLCNFEQSKMLKELGFEEDEVKYSFIYDEDSYCFEGMTDDMYFCLCKTEDGAHHINNVLNPTISLAKNWLYEKYGVWIYAHYELDSFRAYAGKEYGYLFFYCITSNNPHAAESVCLTEVLKKLTN